MKKEKAAFVREAEAMYDEIAAQVTVRRRALMGRLLNGLARQQGDGSYAEATCPDCGARMKASGRRRKEVLHSEGETRLERAYHHCPNCGRGLFPPRPTVAVE